MTLVCHHSGGEDVAELNTGSYYVIQQLKDDLWVDVEFAPQKYDIAWTMEAWIIPKEDTIGSGFMVNCLSENIALEKKS